MLPLGSYDVLKGMDWLEQHWKLVNCKDKTINFLANLCDRKDIQGVRREFKLLPIYAHQLGKCICKGCKIYVIQVGYANSKDNMSTLENIPVIYECKNVFVEEIPRLPPTPPEGTFILQ